MAGDVSDPALEALWKKVLDDWDNEAAHGAFLEYCQSSGRLVEAAVRYRGMAGDHERGPSAEKHLKSVLALAMAQLETLRSPRPERRSRAGSIALILLFIGGTLGILAYLATSR